MNCPCCNTPTVTEAGADGVENPVCPQCGWGREPAEVSAPPSPSTTAFCLRFSLMWLITLVLLAGPYIGLRYLLVELESFVALDDALSQLNRHYVLFFVGYLALSWALSPKYDRTNLGIFGGDPRSEYNPAFTPEQHYNRLMRTFYGLLMPGKIILGTLRTTFELFRKPKPKS